MNKDIQLWGVIYNRAVDDLRTVGFINREKYSLYMNVHMFLLKKNEKGKGLILISLE